MWLKEINNMLVPPPVNYVTDEGITIINFNQSETAMLANGWTDWTEQEIEEWEATHPAPEPPAKPYYTKAQVDDLIDGVKQEIPEAPVQSDWDEADSEALSYIQNKPTIPAAQVQADWDQSDSTAVDYIKNKPTKFDQKQADWDESDSSDVSYIRNKPDMSGYALLNGNNSFVGDQTFTGGFNVKTSTSRNILKNSAPNSGSPNATNTEVTLGDVNSSCLYLRGSNWEFVSGSYAIYVSNRTSSNKVFRLGVWPAVRDSTVGYVQITPTSLDVKFDLVITNGDLTFTPSGASEATTLSTVVGRITALESGTEILTPSTTTIAPQDNKVYQHMLADADVLTIDTSALISTAQVQFELHLIQPASPVTFTLPSNIVWSSVSDFAAGNPAPTMSTGDTLYCIVLRWTGRRLLGSLAYTEYMGADISDSN